MKIPKLKPCPFCGAGAKFGQVPDNENDSNSGGHFIQCTNPRCEASSALVFAAMDDPRRELAERWNSRAGDMGWIGEMLERASK